MAQRTWEAELIEQRRLKDRAFAGPESPLPAHERARFKGLAYFPPDPAYTFELELDAAKVKAIEVPRTGGDVVEYRRVGTFSVKLPEGAVTVATYDTGNAEAGEVFIPFKDATSGKETYGGGRYLEAHPLPTGRYLVDFNLAYNPFCVYNEDFSCPLPPRENWLTVPVRAGERMLPP